MNQYLFTNSLLTTIKSLKNNETINSWVYKGKTNIAYGSPNGGWDVDGYLFEKKDKSYSYVLRSVPNAKGSSFIVIESINIRGQLYNMDLNNSRTFKQNQGKTYLLESYRMTAGKGKVKEIDVENSFKSIGISVNEISIIDDKQPNWIKTITDILEWGILREKVKIALKNSLKKTTTINDSSTKEKMKRISLNQILYGPPGTGKTYNTINKAIAIVNPLFDLNQKRIIVKAEYDKLVNEGKIAFSTFHQSMSYEDFIEGIKPLNPEDDDTFLKYDIESGIFKIASANAAYLCYKKYSLENKKNSNYTFDELHEAFIEHIQELMNNNKVPIYKTLKGRDVTVIDMTSTNSIKARALNSKATRNPAPLTKENLQKLYDKFESIEEIKNLQQVQETVEITPRITEFYAIFKALKEFEKNEFKPDTDELNEIEVITSEEKIKKFNAGVYSKAIKDYGKIAEPVVLIIDEINRGNVSAIFGELITLIEENKRLGNNEALEIILPYSKKKFGVPPNLYIIGTMNTADRSVEALDTALRRRFSFEEMPPLYDLKELDYSISEYKAADILKTINTRIEKLINKDHAIGHSYFLNKDNETIVASFYKNIIPLLQEYFFGDYGKIGLVLGKGFIRLKEYEKKTTVFADFDTDTANDFDDRNVYEIIDYRNKIDYKLTINKTVLEMDFYKAIQVLMNKKFE